MPDLREHTQELQDIITGDPLLHDAWRFHGMSGVVRLLAKQRDEAREVARGCNLIIKECDVLADILPGDHPLEMELYAKKYELYHWREELPWLAETTDEA